MMTPTETNQLIDKHLEGWLGSGAADTDRFTLRGRIASAITEALERQAKLYQAGSDTLIFQRDLAEQQLKDMRQARNDAVAAARQVLTP